MCPLFFLEMYLFFVGAPIRVLLSGSIARVLAWSLAVLRVFHHVPPKNVSDRQLDLNWEATIQTCAVKCYFNGIAVVT